MRRCAPSFRRTPLNQGVVDVRSECGKVAASKNTMPDLPSKHAAKRDVLRRLGDLVAERTADMGVQAVVRSAVRRPKPPLQSQPKVKLALRWCPSLPDCLSAWEELEPEEESSELAE